MKTVVLSGKDSEADFAEFLQDRLSCRFCVTMLSNKRLSSKGSKEELLLLHTDSWMNCPKDTVFILGSSCDPKDFPAICGGAAAIFWSDREVQRKFLMEAPIPAISCGYSPKDLVTYSSKKEDSCVLSLQRNLKSVSGTMVSPFEFPAGIPPKDDYWIMSLFALCVVFGCFDNNFL